MNLKPAQFDRILSSIPNTSLILYRENLEIIKILDGDEILKDILPSLSSVKNLAEADERHLNIEIHEMCRNAFSESSIEYQFIENYGQIEFRTLSFIAPEGIRTGILVIQAKKGILDEGNDELWKEKEEALETSEIKSRFMARISHEIRTPLNAIIGFIEQLNKTQLSEKQKDYLKIIDKSSIYLLDLVNEILTYSKLESGQQQLELIDFKCEALFNEIYNTFKNRANEKKINLRYLFDNKLNLILKGDTVRLKQIVINLVSNALKFTEYGYVELKVERAREDEEKIWVRIKVTDTGIGISENKMEEIFKEYKQASAGITRKHGGTGLGLTISKRLTELMNGNISVSSVEGMGSVFTVEIPLIKSNLSSLTKDTLQINTEVLSGKSALIVDDDAMNRMLGEIILEGFNMDVSLASDGTEAMRLLEKKNFEIILLDIHMPVVSGYDVADYVRNSRNDKKVRIIAVTADMNREELENYLQKEIDDYIIKPYREISLFNKLCQVMEIDSDLIRHETIQIVLQEDTESQLYDLGELRSVTRGSEAFFTEMIQTFIENAIEGIQQIRAAAGNKAWTDMRETAHRLIPSFKHLSIKSVVSDLVELKNVTGQSPDKNRVMKLIHRIEEATEQVVNELKQEKYMEQ
jgi:signal transduction histidine kinase/response regulator of citrate/malate metabolism